MSISDYRKRREQQVTRNPSRFEQEQEQARQWSLRMANRGRAKEKEM